MSLDWTIDAEARLVVIVADGDVARGEMDTLLDELIAKEALAFRKLFDGSRGDTSMNAEELLMLGVRFRAIHTQGRMGPLAVVVAEHKAELVAQVLGILAVADRPMRVFRAPALARLAGQVDGQVAGGLIVRPPPPICIGGSRDAMSPARFCDAPAHQ